MGLLALAARILLLLAGLLAAALLLLTGLLTRVLVCWPGFWFWLVISGSPLLNVTRR